MRRRPAVCILLPDCGEDHPVLHLRPWLVHRRANGEYDPVAFQQPVDHDSLRVRSADAVTFLQILADSCGHFAASGLVHLLRSLTREKHDGPGPRKSLQSSVLVSDVNRIVMISLKALTEARFCQDL